MSKVRMLFRPMLAAFLAVTVLALTAQQTNAADRRDFTLINASPSVTIYHVYVSASDDNDWGDDILDVDVVFPGDSVDVYFSRFDGEAGKCLYDIKVVGDSGEEGFLWAVNLCTTTTVTFR
jgi:hypothetical protein